jgi:rhodanese-related sulfurtransferase
MSDTTNPAVKESLRAADLVAAAKARIENLSVEQVAEELERGEALLVDVREADERIELGSVTGALGRPRGMLEFWADPTHPMHSEEFDPNRRTILYCAAGSRSALAADTLRQLGYARVAHLEGGFKAWTAAGRPVEPVTA